MRNRKCSQRWAFVNCYAVVSSPCKQGAGFGELPVEVVTYESIVLVFTMPYEVPAMVALYRERGDAENPFDELKNQWGWAGFTTQDLDRCQVTARVIAQIYN